VQEAFGGYFKDPSAESKKVGTKLVGSGENFSLTKDSMPKLKEELQKSIRQLSNFDKCKSQIEMAVTAEGLRIELLESASGTFFDSGKPAPNDEGKQLLSNLRKKSANSPNKVTLEGHTDSKPLQWRARLRQLGVFRRSRERSQAVDAVKWPTSGSGVANPWLRRPTIAGIH
jgi:chemotaxis protein MotB